MASLLHFKPAAKNHVKDNTTHQTELAMLKKYVNKNTTVHTAAGPLPLEPVLIAEPSQATGS
ncbi:hypothetical protein T06_7850 [Trichinella sp. T6]|nr:hypothetical protein T06_7850 [Trichinella sp. T6]